MFYKGKELKKYDIHATDGNIGTVHEFSLTISIGRLAIW
jgi:hypothetical protein